uniref:DUF38 domain-containing protein n=1 Tax=Panagrolaimus sp. ES5 TaxID=591445 RepID=A0AC34FU27_9BILA
MSSCLFCNSEYHHTPKCEEYETMEERTEIAKTKNFCLSCFAKSASPHSVGKECKNDETCGGWYSTEHHTLFCPKRFKESWDYGRHRSFKNLLVVVHSLRLQGSNETVVYAAINAKVIICKARIVQLRNIKIPSKDLTKVVTIYTKELIIQNIKSDITFTEMIKLAPNIEVFEILDASLKIDEKTWIDDLLKYKKGKNFRQLSLCLHGIEFNLEMLKKFIMTKSVNDVKIKIKYESTELRQNLNEFINKNSKHLTEQFRPVNEPNVILGFDSINDYRSFKFNIQNEDKKDTVAAIKNIKIMPLRSAKKRCFRYSEM